MFITINLEIADRFIPSYCSISIIKWDKGRVVSQLNYLLDPETKIEPFMTKKHGIENSHVFGAKTLRDIWHEVYDMIEGELVIIDGATSFINSFKKRCIIDSLRLPDFKYACSRSMFNKSYKDKKDFKSTIPEIKNFLEINTPNYNAYYDALAIKNIVDFCLYETSNFDIWELYQDVGFVVGGIKDNNIMEKKDVINEIEKKGGFYEK